MIDLGTLAGLHEHHHRLDAYGPRCDRWAELDLAGMIDAGLGEGRLPIRARCRDCGDLGRLQVRPPVPTHGPGGWMEPQARSLKAGDTPGASPPPSRRVLVRLLVGQVAVPGVEFGQPLELVRELPQRPRRLLDPVLRHQAQQERAGGALHLW